MWHVIKTSIFIYFLFKSNYLRVPLYKEADLNLSRRTLLLKDLLVVKEKIIDLVIEVKNNSVEKNQFHNETNIIDDIGIDSLELINFILLVEDEFDMELDFENFEISHMHNLERFCSFIIEKNSTNEPVVSNAL